MEHPDVQAAHERCTAAKMALNYARSRHRQEPNPGHLKKLQEAKSDWELAWTVWGQKLKAHPDEESKRDWESERRAQDAIPFIG